MKDLTLPPSEKRKQYELRGLSLRDFAGLGPEQPLDPFALARFAKLFVVDFNRVEGLAPELRAHLLGPAAHEWSGGACARPLPNGWRIVILNPADGVRRNRATLMEEIAHVFLGHKPNRLGTAGAPTDLRGEPHNKPPPTADSSARKASKPDRRAGSGRVVAREYDQADEEAAYAIGAAALAPYATLRRMVLEGLTAADMADHFRVSRQLAEYRIKVTHLWADYQRLVVARGRLMTRH